MDSDKHETKNNSNMKMAVKTDSVKTGRLCSEYESKLVSTPVIDNDFSNAESFTKEPGFSRLKGFSLLSTDRRKNRALLINEETEIRRAINDGVPVNTLARLCKVHVGVIHNIENKSSMLSTATNRESKTINSNTVRSDSNAGSSNAYTTSRKKQNMLSLADKLEALQRVENGETPASLAVVYNVTEGTLHRWIRDKNKIKELDSRCKSKHILKERKYIQNSISISTENDLCEWYSQKLTQGKKVPHQDLRKKALELNKNLCGPSGFKASKTWLLGFKSRYRKKQLHSQSQSFTGDTSAANPIQSHLRLLPEEFSRDDICTTDETEIDWQSMPKNSVTYNNDKCNETAARVTVMACANASGSHLLPLLVIGNTKKKICLKKFVCPPVIYKWQRNGSMDSEIFKEWYTNEFIRAVKTVHGQAGTCGKVLVLLHNSPFHVDIDKLNEVDENFKVGYLPSNVTPINQILIEKLKLIFEKDFLQCLQIPPENKGELTCNSQKLTLEKCCYMLSNAWNILRQDNKKKPCNEQSSITEGHRASAPKSENYMVEFSELFKKNTGFSQRSKENACESLLIDTINPGHRVHNESETIASLESQELSEAYNTADVDTSDERRPTNSEALVSLEIVSEWLEEQKKSQGLSEAYNTDNVDTRDESCSTNSEASAFLQTISEWLQEPKEFG